MAHVSRWTAIVCGSCAVLAAWLIPPEPWSAGRYARYYENRTPERHEANRLRSEVGALNTELRERRAAALIAQTVAESGVRPGERLIRHAPEHNEESRQWIDRWVEGELGDISDDTEMAFALTFMDWRLGSHDDLPDRIREDQDANVFVGLDAPVPYCAVVMRYDPRSLNAWQKNPNEQGRLNRVTESLRRGLASCAWFLEYGMPGTRIAHWLVDQDFLGTGIWPAATVAVRSILPARGVFGTMRTSSGTDGLATSCLAGREGSCERVLGLNGERWLGAYPDPDVPNWAYSTDNTVLNRGEAAFGIERRLLSTLENDFGKEAFSAFWTSDRPVGEAFQDAFGTEFPRWLREQARSGAPALEAGPGVDVEDFGLALLTVFSFLAVASFVAKRREV